MSRIVLDHAAPVRVGRLHAEPEEAERGDEQEGEAEAQAEFGGQRRNRIGQDFARDDPPPAFAAQARRLDEFETDDVHRRPRARGETPWASRACAIVTISTGTAVPSTDRTTKAKIKRRHRQHEVDEARERQVDPAARDRGGEAGDDADGEGERRDDERKADRQPRAVDQAADDVAPEIVEPEPMMRVGVRPGVADGCRPDRTARSSGANTATNRLIATIARPICARR